MKKLFVLIAIVSMLLVSACATTTGGQRNVVGPVVADTAQSEVPESQLLNASIEVFDPGVLPEDEKEANGLSMDIRKAEARYMPEQLRATMESTGYWGAVRVVPQGLTNSELLVSGTILHSTGLQLDLQITAKDASGRTWFTKQYRDGVEAAYYQSSRLSGEAFQPLYNTIANDLARFLKQLSTDEITNIRRIAELRFAADIAPDAFNGYLGRNEDGEYAVVHLPSTDDPMYSRVLAIQERDLLMIDTLNGHFDNFYREMQDPYTEWRKSRSDEAEKQKALEKAALNRTLLGVASIVGAIFVGVAAGDDYDQGLDTLSNVMLAGGSAAIYSGMEKRSEAGEHREYIEELGLSFSSAARPMVVEVDGETIQLTGSAEAQYEQWRVLMKQIYASETGLTGSLD
jgi:hypothetical protein